LGQGHLHRAVNLSFRGRRGNSKPSRILPTRKSHAVCVLAFCGKRVYYFSY